MLRRQDYDPHMTDKPHNPNPITIYLTIDPASNFGVFFQKFAAVVPDAAHGPLGSLVMQCKSAVPENSFVVVTIEQKDGKPWACRIPSQMVALIIDVPPSDKKIGFT